jgi:hypothetical protein
LLLGSNNRYIAVAEDLNEMFQLLNPPSTPCSVDTTSDITTLDAFSLYALSLLNTLGRSRYNLPWRWRPWSLNYQQALQ